MELGRSAPEPPLLLGDQQHRALVETEVAVLAHDGRETRVRVIRTGEEFRLRGRHLLHLVPGQVATLVLELRASGAVGELRAIRVDVEALKLPKLQLHERETLTARPLLGHTHASREAQRTAYEMEQALPGAGRGGDPILASLDLRAHGDVDGATAVLTDLLRRDLRCIDAHAHLGNFVFPACAEHARLHYEVGVAIGDHALGPDFRGALPWSYLDNRPYLRCLHGLGLSLWRLGRLEEAVLVFERLLWLNSTDEQNASECLRDVRTGCAWG